MTPITLHTGRRSDGPITEVLINPDHIVCFQREGSGAAIFLTNGKIVDTTEPVSRIIEILKGSAA